MLDDTLILNSDNIIEIPALTNGLTGAAVNNATVQLTLLTTGDTEIPGQVWPLAMDYVAGSAGTYRATAAYTLTLAHKQKVKAVVVADAGGGFHREWQKFFTVIIGSN
ncbi:MAG: hypothetical protein RRB22_01195 [Gammaproteobacteria bacterium]|nr:hypothetical protein [Gammaproteobacteria bacterium]